MEADIRVGMTDKAARVRYGDAAQPNMVAGPEGMDVEALAGTDVAAARGKQPFGPCQIIHRRHLEIVLAALDQRDGDASAFSDGSIVGQFGARRRAMGLDDRLVVETLWCLGSP